MKKKAIITISVMIAILVLCGIYLHYENTKLQVSNYNIINHNIPVDFNNYKIVQISDFHNNKSNALTNDLIKLQIEEKINEIKDDLNELDKEKVAEIAKEKANMIKKKVEELAATASKKATPAIEKTIEELRKTALKATKEIEKKLEK